jgi:hypothetical protein
MFFPTYEIKTHPKTPKMAVEHNYLKIVVYRVNPDDRRTTSMTPNEAPEMTRPKPLQA